jgi:glutamate decarboxylase
MPIHSHEHHLATHDRLSVRPQFGLGLEMDVPKLRLAEQGMSPATAFQIIHDELMLDGNARLNLATFVTTWMEPEAEKLMAECSPKNMIDKDEYPQTAEMERRCVNMLAHLWNAAGEEDATGCSTTGSSEACMLGGLALKWRWRKMREAAGKPATQPNIVMGTNVQVCWEKFCRYFDVEPRLVDVGPEVAHLDAKAAAAACDENTIGVVAILGSTYDGSYEPVEEIAAELDKLAASAPDAPDVQIHVDGASGGMIAPFLDPDLLWDFRLPRVQSINTSGHKYGLVYPGVGWIVWRGKEALPDELVFKVDYLGGEMPTFALNFSRPGAQVVGQYFNFLRLGIEGYADVQAACRRTAMWLAEEIAAIGRYELMSKGWLVPAYPMPEGMEEIAVLRVVVRNGLSHDLATMLLADIRRVTAELEEQHAARPAVTPAPHPDDPAHPDDTVPVAKPHRAHSHGPHRQRSGFHH